MIISSIDIMAGKVVQLRQGREKVLEREDAPELARRFDRTGEVAVIDLDAAMGLGDNRSVIAPLLGLAECRVGGGIRTVQQAREWIGLGAAKVIVGSAAFADGGIAAGFLERLGAAIGRQRLIVAVDCDGEEIVSQGWRRRTGVNLFAAAVELEKYCGELLCTVVRREGTMAGIDMPLVERLRRRSGLKLTVAGGVSSLDEVEALSALGCDVQLGMALYTGKIDPAAAFIASLRWSEEGLLPAIVQDEAGRVLMLAYCDRESLQRTFASGRMCYRSRSRRCLWTKGEISGHFQDLLRLRADCDRDTLLATVRQTGPACHSGEETCFGPKRFDLHDLEQVIASRLREGRPGSYTASLSQAEAREKLAEEAGEVIAAERPEELAWEAADLIYFLLVCLGQKGVGLDSALRELSRRRRR